MTARIIALGGGGFSNDPDVPEGRRLDQVILDATGKQHPRLCFIGTASGDAEGYALTFYRAFSGRAETHDLSLFSKSRHPGLREFILGMDAIYVGGGSTLNMLAVWRAHGLDAILAEAWQAGVVLAGMSAGMVCWFESPVTDAFHDGTIRATPGLGLLPAARAPTSTPRCGEGLTRRWSRQASRRVTPPRTGWPSSSKARPCANR